MNKTSNKASSVFTSKKSSLESKILPDSTTCTFLVEESGDPLKRKIKLVKYYDVYLNPVNIYYTITSVILSYISEGRELVGGATRNKSKSYKNSIDRLQLSANAKHGSEIISDMFPNDLFEDDTRLEGSTTTLSNLEINSLQSPEVKQLNYNVRSTYY